MFSLHSELSPSLNGIRSIRPQVVLAQVDSALVYILRYKLANLNVKQKVCSE